MQIQLVFVSNIRPLCMNIHSVTPQNDHRQQQETTSVGADLASVMAIQTKLAFNHDVCWDSAKVRAFHNKGHNTTHRCSTGQNRTPQHTTPHHTRQHPLCPISPIPSSSAMGTDMGGCCTGRFAAPSGSQRTDLDMRAHEKVGGPRCPRLGHCWCSAEQDDCYNSYGHLRQRHTGRHVSVQHNRQTDRPIRQLPYKIRACVIRLATDRQHGSWGFTRQVSGKSDRQIWMTQALIS